MINNEIWTGNNIGAEGARMISESLKTNTTLTELDLSCDENEINENTHKQNKQQKQATNKQTNNNNNNKKKKIKKKKMNNE